MKAGGMYLARSISFEGTESHCANMALTAEQCIVYDRAAAWWAKAQKQIGAGQNALRAE